MNQNIKRLPNSLRLGGTPLDRAGTASVPPKPDGVRRANESCVELETYANYVHGGAASFVAMSIVVSIVAFFAGVIAIGVEDISGEQLMIMLALSPTLTIMALIFYFAGGTHKSRGAYVRVHRGTRKLYFVYPRQKRTHVLAWDQLEAVAGYIPIISANGYFSRHPLYLIGVDYSMDPPSEVCVACGNLGLFTGDQSAKGLWSYLFSFMENGPQGLPKPALLAPRLSRAEETLKPYRNWYIGLRHKLSQPNGILKAPITIPFWLILLVIEAYPDSFEAFLQYNVPFAQFPEEIDRLCGFD